MFHLALKIMLYDKTRTLMTLLGVVFAVSLIFAQLCTFLGLMETASVIIDKTPGDIWITSKNSRNFDFSQPVPDYIYYSVLNSHGVESAEKLIVAWGVIKNVDGGMEQVEIIGFNPETGVGGPWKMESGVASSVKNGNFMIMDRSARKRLGDFKIGDDFDVLWHKLRLVGISDGVKSFTTAPIVFTSHHLAQALVSWMGPDNTSFVIATVQPGVKVETLVSTLREKLNGVDVYSKQQFSQKTRNYWAIETGVGFSFLLTVIISFLIGMLIVGQTIYNSTMEHIKEFGTLKAMGADNVDIYKVIFSQSLVTSLLGYSLSVVITAVSAAIYEMSGMVMVLNVQVSLLVLALTVIMCFGASFASVRRIRRIDPAILFRG